MIVNTLEMAINLLVQTTDFLLGLEYDSKRLFHAH